MRNLEFAYRIESGAHMAEDENGNPTECYAKLVIENCRDDVTDEEIEKVHMDGKKYLSNIDPKYITLVDIEEYDRECNEGGENNEGADMG